MTASPLRWLARLVVCAAMVAGAAAAATPKGSVVDTRHNLSATGPGPIRAPDEKEICIFCHAAHPPESGPTLWNHLSSSNISYRAYARETMKTEPGRVDGSSVQCLSCHDGTIALGAVHSRPEPIRMFGADAAGRLSRERTSNLGTDLSGTHPVSVQYAEALGNADTSSVRVRDLSPEEEKSWLDSAGKVQCTSCHDPHVDPATSGAHVPPFWRGDTVSEVCETCHTAPLVDAAHDDPRLLANGCGSCHVGHGVSGEALLPKREEQACYSCHGTRDDAQAATAKGHLTPIARPAAIEALFSLQYRHPVEESAGLHVIGEDLAAEGAAAPRHVECVDCHAQHGEPAAPVRKGRGAASGMVGGRPEYEVCYTCHGAVSNLPYGQKDKSAELDPNNRSFHPIESPSPTSSVPSLLSPWREGMTMSCSDCHTNEDPDRPQGPHGSRFPWILKAAYTVVDGEPESVRAYELCYSCHSRTTILSDQTFAGHAQHVVTERSSCYACHDSHGSAEDPGLVRFGKDIRYTDVRPAKSGRLEYDEETGACWLTCHDVEHDALGYGP